MRAVSRPSSVLVVLIVAAAAAAMPGCGGGGGGGGGAPPPGPAFPPGAFTGSFALATTDPAAAPGTANLFSIDAAGNVTSIDTGIVIEDMVALQGGVLLNTPTSFMPLVGPRYFWVEYDTALAYEIASVIGGPLQSYFKSQNRDGDLILRDGIFRQTTKTKEAIDSNLANPFFNSGSGNFAVLSAENGSVNQVYDSITGLRFNIGGFSPIVALSDTRLLTQGSSNDALFDMTTGTRLPSQVGSWSEALALPVGGAVVISSSVPPQNGGEQHLGLVAPDGTVTTLLSADIDPAPPPNFPTSVSTVLFGTGRFFVIREVTRVTAVESGIDARIEILSGLNVIGVSVVDALVYYIAETPQGDPVSGMFDLDTMTDTRFTSPQDFESIGAVIR